MESVIDRQRPARRGGHKNGRPLSVQGPSGQKTRRNRVLSPHTQSVDTPLSSSSLRYSGGKTPAGQSIPRFRAGSSPFIDTNAQHKALRGPVDTPGQRSLTILGRVEQNDGEGILKYPSGLLGGIVDTFLTAFRAIPATIGPVAVSHRLSRVLSADLNPLDQGFVAGALLFLCTSLVVIGDPAIARTLSYDPFPESISLDFDAVPEVLGTETSAGRESGANRHVSEESVELDVSRFERLEFEAHTVQSGETLSGIAREYGITLDTLVSFNQISDSRRVQVGTQFDIPSRNGLRHIVERGDSVDAIAQEYSVETDEILDANDMQSVSLNPGDELFIPDARMRQTELRLILGELFIRPATGRFTSGFGNRIDPFTGRRSFHNGVDWTNVPGTPIVASMAGRVAEVGRNPVYGDYVVIEHPENFQSMYAHLSQINVSRGESVSQRQRIGTMGNTGRSTGTHLHFSLFENGRPVDPLRHVH